MFLLVRITAGAKKNILTELGVARFNIEVKAKAKDNQANAKMIALIANYFKITEKKVRIVRGHHRSQKIVLVQNE